jgi:hypothetical protein
MEQAVIGVSTCDETHMLPTLLITSAIAPPANTPALRMTDPNMRAITTKAAVFFWVGQGQKRIVICDSTGSSVLSDEELSNIRKVEVSIEQIAYQQDDALVVERGKAFAEGQLIKFAVDNSELLIKSGHFFKCTGKMFCRNFAAIWDLIAKNNIANMFWKLYEHTLIDRNLVDPRFFYTSIVDFHRFVLPAYARSSESQILEYQLSLSLNSHLSRGAGRRPLLSGFSGGLGDQCQEHYLGDLDMNYPCWYSLRQGK